MGGGGKLEMKIPESEVKRVKENLKRQKTMNDLLSATPEFQEQARLFRTWVALCGIPEVKCPVCAEGHLTFSCGHGDVEGALVLARNMVQEHSKEAKRVREKIEQEYPELELVPLPRDDNSHFDVKGEKEVKG